MLVSDVSMFRYAQAPLPCMFSIYLETSSYLGLLTLYSARKKTKKTPGATKKHTCIKTFSRKIVIDCKFAFITFFPKLTFLASV